jgi:hypothetical protein
MKTQAACCSLFVLVVLALTSTAQAGPPSTGPHPIVEKSPNSWVENFENPFVGWQDRWFYKHTNAEGYYVLCGNRPDYRPSDQQGIWIGARGINPTDRSFTLAIKPSLGLEATYFSFGVNSHLQRLSITFLDKKGKTIAVSCAPRTNYYQYVTVAVKIKNGLSAIRFDGHGTQVSGNVNINHVEAIFGPVPENKKFQIHELQKGKCKVIPERPAKPAIAK